MRLHRSAIIAPWLLVAAGCVVDVDGPPGGRGDDGGGGGGGDDVDAGVVVDSGVDDVDNTGPGEATLEGPTRALAHDPTAAVDADDIVDPVFAITLTRPASVATVSVQRSPSVEPPVWVEVATVTAPAEATLRQAVAFDAPGDWLVRVVLEDAAGNQSASTPHALTALRFSLVATVDDSLPIAGAPVTLTATLSPPAPADFGNVPAGWFVTGPDATPSSQGPTNPLTSTPPDTTPRDWSWVEVFPDGSRLVSNVVRVSPQAAPPSEIVVVDGACADLQQGLEQAAAADLPLRLQGTFTVDCRVRLPADVVVDATAATFVFTKAGRIRNATLGARGGYTHAGGFVWDGGTFVGAGNGLFTISHAPGFTIRNTVMYAWADAADDGHAIEINSSGGPHTPGVFTVVIADNTFLGLTGQRANSNDEAVQYDFAWDGSGGDAPFDATMTHNVHIARNTFHRLDESGTWEFSLCAIGGHRGSAGEPAERHNGFLIEDNVIHGAVGASVGVSPDKGAIALWNARDVVVRNNDFFGVTASRIVSAWDANPDRALNDATMNLSFAGNSHNGRAVTITMPSSNSTGG